MRTRLRWSCGRQLEQDRSLLFVPLDKANDPEPSRHVGAYEPASMLEGKVPGQRLHLTDMPPAKTDRRCGEESFPGREQGVRDVVLMPGDDGDDISVVIEKAGANYSAYVPDLPGCVATGASRDEVEREIRDAIAFHVEGLREDGLPVPPPTTQLVYVDADEGQLATAPRA